MNTTRLSNGAIVLLNEKTGHAFTYSNRTQAQRKAAEVGGEVIRAGGRPFYVRMPDDGAPITMRVEADMVESIDPTGEQRRAGSLNLKAVPITEALDAWTPRTAKVSFRVDRQRGRLYRRDVVPAAFGGYQIRYISLGNFRLMREWLENYEV